MLRLASIYYPALGYEGYGMACVIYFKGCHNSCDGCHNAHLQSFTGGEVLSIPEMFSRIKDHTDPKYVDSYVFSGGEPLHQDVNDIIALALKLHELDKPLWLYTSKLLKEIDDNIKSVFDVIVDGPFIKALSVPGLKFRGSTNQKVWYKIADVIDGTSMWREEVVEENDA